MGLFEDVDVEEDVEEEVDPYTKACSGCEDLFSIDRGEEVTLLQVMTPIEKDGEIIVEVATHYDDTPLYEPLFYCATCLNDLREQIANADRDTPPIRHKEAVAECDECHSSILHGENLITLDLGVLVTSPRSGLPQFRAYGGHVPTRHICIVCAVKVSGQLEDSESGELWEELSEGDECAECTVARCWRTEGQCGCNCH